MGRTEIRSDHVHSLETEVVPDTVLPPRRLLVVEGLEEGEPVRDRRVDLGELQPPILRVLDRVPDELVVGVRRLAVDSWVIALGREFVGFALSWRGTSGPDPSSGGGAVGSRRDGAHPVGLGRGGGRDHTSARVGAHTGTRAESGGDV